MGKVRQAMMPRQEYYMYKGVGIAAAVLIAEGSLGGSVLEY